MTLPFFVLVAVGGTVFVFWMLSFDALVRRIYADDRDFWVSLGKPPGWMWSPPDTNWVRGAAVRQRLVTNTRIYRPAWIKGNPIWNRLWLRMSFLSSVAFVMPIVLMLYMFTTDA